jgi:arabinan endo-1,5-alpha-L-arabinosidase
MRLSILFIYACLHAWTHISGQVPQAEKLNNTNYSNPVYASSLPDPTVIRAGDGAFYLYATEDIHNTPILRSTDLVHWKLVATAFTNKTRPSFEPRGGIWAPDINCINDQYVLYYAMSVWGGEMSCGIGVATCNSPEGPFTDRRKLIGSNEIGVQNSIDPFFIREDSKNYLFWGSFHGIYVIGLTDDGLAILPGASKRQVAGNAYEGGYILKKDGFFYMFCSTGSCCEGINSTYTTVAGRSENLFGPYLNKEGKSMSDNMHEVIIHGNERFVGTGHNSEILEDKQGRTWILYHAVDRNNPKGRVLMLDEVKWENGWPFVQDDSPSSQWEPPSW